MFFLVALVLSLAVPVASASPLLDTSRPLALRQAVDLALHGQLALRQAGLDLMLQQANWQAVQQAFSPQTHLSANTAAARGGDPRGQSGVAATTALKLRSGATVSIALSRNETRPAAGDTVRSMTTTLQLVQPLLRGNPRAATLGLQAADIARDIARLQYRLAVSDTVANTVSTFLDVLLAQEQAGLAADALQRSRDVLSMNQSLLDAGRIAAQDLLQSRLDISQNEFALAQALDTEVQSKQLLLRLFGEAGADVQPSALQLEPVLPDAEGSVTGIDTREDVGIAQALVDLADNALRQADDRQRPQLDLVVGAQPRGWNSGGIATAGTASVGLQFQTDFGDPLARLQRSAARVELRKSVMSLRDLRLAAQAELASASRGLEFTRRQASLAEQLRSLADQRLAGEIEKAKAGRNSTFELSAAQDALRQAQANAAIARLAVPRARLQFDRVCGRVLAAWGGEPPEVPLE